jgi:beta-glucosidase
MTNDSPIPDVVDALVGDLAVGEAANIAAGFGMWHNHRVTRLGIPAIKVTDGPVGARGAGEIGSGTPALVLPCPTAMAATWDPDLVGSAAVALAAEVRDRSASVLLAPTVNLHRTPLAGRNFECFGEDPHLTARMAVGYITGVQSAGVSACVKHFVANDQEHERHTISAEVSERALRELYLVPFEAAVTEAGVWMVMSAYNRLNGTYCGEHPWLLTDVLRGEWGFDGAVVSDWLGTHSTVDAALAGLDWEMPGPAVHFGARLADAVDAGDVPADVVLSMARNVLGVAGRTGLLDDVAHGVVAAEPAERSVDRDDARQLARQVAAAGIVVLANRVPASQSTPVLPLDPVPATVAIIGPNADGAWIQGGGSAQLNAHRAVTPRDGLTARLGAAGCTVTYEPGCLSVRSMPLLGVGNLVVLPGDTPGVADAAAGPDDRFCVVAEYFDNPEFAGDPVSVVPMRAATAMWAGVMPPGVTGTYWARWRATMEVAADATVRFGITSAGPSRLFVDGALVCDLWDARQPGESFFGLGSAEVTGDVAPPDGADPGATRCLDIVFELSNHTTEFISAGKVGAAVVPPADAVGRAVAAAAAAEVAVVVVGLNHDTETEGRDRTTLSLPAEQDELVAAVAAANDRTVVVVNAGAPVHMPWRNDVAAVVQLWYPGQEGGHALADVLTGDVNPSGRLPTTFPADIADNPSHGNYPGDSGVVRYEEDVLIGYRWYDAHGIEPEWCFGHGLSYTSFDLGEPDVELLGGLVPGALPPASLGAGEGRHVPAAVRVVVPVTNTGDRDGHQVVQVYVEPPDGPLVRPPRELRGFSRVWVPAGATVDATVDLGVRAFAAFDPAVGRWVVAPGTHTVAVGTSCRVITSRSAVVVA